MYCELVSEPLNPYETLEQYDQHLRSSCSSIGACANFIGNMRDVNDSKSVKSMLLEHYPGMTEKELKGLEIFANENGFNDEPKDIYI